MPIYEYRCNECQQVFEEWQKDFEEREVPCPICGGSATRLISHSAFILKGSGWYVTDYCNRKSSSNANAADAKGKKEKTADQKGQTASATTSNTPANSSATQSSSSA
ncbi:FmdB family zinc ribbon protein [Desulfovulcanus sp.]